MELDQVESELQRELLEAQTVYAEPIESFKQRVVREATPTPPPPPVPTFTGTPVVFINAERRDRALAETIRDQVDRRFMTMLPIDQGSASEVREDLEEKLLDCDALLLVYGEGGLSWVDKQLLYCNKVVPKPVRFGRTTVSAERTR